MINELLHSPIIHTNYVLTLLAVLLDTNVLIQYTRSTFHFYI